jgi:hypothetical protein
MSADPDEVVVVAEALCQFYRKQMGNYPVPRPNLLSIVAKDHPLTYHEIIDEAEVIIEAINKHRAIIGKCK